MPFDARRIAGEAIGLVFLQSAAHTRCDEPQEVEVCVSHLAAERAL